MQLSRASGILLHPTSFPSRYGIGELGGEAYNFIDFLAQSGQKLWQILPLNPPGFGASPYQAYSAFANNSLLISIDELLQEGLLTGEDLAELPDLPEDRCDYPLVSEYKQSLLFNAYMKFKKIPDNEGFHEYVERNYFWLYDYSFFMALREHFAYKVWNEWPQDILYRQKEALGYYGNLLSERIEFHCFLQYIFYKQWMKLKCYAHKKSIVVIGDLPIFISYDSVDTWVNPQMFALNKDGTIAKKAGVPPDYFSETGQLWGNPHYCWETMEKDNYFWWQQRFKTILEMADVVRLDHFRGFESYWEIPGNEKTAVLGRWAKGPGKNFFAAMEENLGRLPLIAEDLGFITPEVTQLKDEFDYPGMKILQFTYAEEIEPARHRQNTVYYTGTHDNDTLLGWYGNFISKSLHNHSSNYEHKNICWDFIEIVLHSIYNWTIFPLQDILCLDSSARMNTPGTVNETNWSWRYKKGSLTPELAEKLKDLTERYNR